MKLYLKNQIYNYIDSILKLKKKSSKESNRIYKSKIAIVGGGIAGLSAASELLNAGLRDFILIESSDDIGGRVRSDYIDGYILDRGFQVFIESYPEAIKSFSYESLDLAKFLPGAIVRYNKKYYKVSDPFRRPEDLIDSIDTPIGSFIDKLKVGIYSILIRFESLDSIFNSNDKSTEQYLLEDLGLSQTMVDTFFKPFYQGIFLSSLKLQSSKMFRFVFKMFTEGSASIPTKGMGEIPKQMASNLPKGSLFLNTKIESIEDNGNRLKASTINKKSNTIEYVDFLCDKVILALDPIGYQFLLNGYLANQTSLSSAEKVNISSIPEGRSSICLYYGMTGLPPVKEPILLLNGENNVDNGFTTTINNICFPSQLSPLYSPVGKSLASVTVVGSLDKNENDIEKDVRSQLIDWFGDNVTDWIYLKQYRIPYAQPSQLPPYSLFSKPSKIFDNIYSCGDHRSSATLNGAIDSGRKAALNVLSELNKDESSVVIS
eukprot:gene18714-24473_t